VLDVVTIAVLAVLCGADSWVDVALFGRSKEAWLRTLLPLPHGMPSHDTFGRVVAALDPAAFEACFLELVRAEVAGAGIALDGKTARHSHDRPQARGPLHLVRAWATDCGVALGQVAVADHANELAALPAVLAAVDLPGAVVTIDAIGGQTAIAQQIVARGGDYVLVLKDNQPTLHDLVVEHFALVATDGPGELAHDVQATLDKNHSRLERRRCCVTDDLAVMAWLDPEQTWPGLRSISAVTGQRRIGTTTSTETRYYLSSLPADAQRIGAAVRGHWGSENRLHWALDLAFREDGAASASAMPPKTSRSSVASRSICCGKTRPSRRAAKPNGSPPAGMMPISAASSLPKCDCPGSPAQTRTPRSARPHIINMQPHSVRWSFVMRSREDWCGAEEWADMVRQHWLIWDGG
jgi:predicted transposase YbfD/YdcC